MISISKVPESNKYVFSDFAEAMELDLEKHLKQYEGR